MKFIQFWFIVLTISFSNEMLAADIYVRDTNVCAGSTIIFRDTHTPPAGRVVINRYWDFGNLNKDTTSGDSVGFTFAPSDAGNSLTVTLISKYDDGSDRTLRVVVFVWNIPVIDTFEADKYITCVGEPIIFRAFSSEHPVAGNSLATWKIEYGDLLGNSFLSKSPHIDNHAYNAQGVYQAEYIVGDGLCYNSKKIEIRILKTPEVKFTPINLRCKDSNVIYENRTADIDTTWRWTWMFNDSLYIKGSMNQDSSIFGNTAYYNTANVTHIHPFYHKRVQVILYGVNKYSCKDRDTQYFSIDTTPTLVITPATDTTICFGESVQYTVRGSDTVFYDQFLWGTKIRNDSIVLFTPPSTISYIVYGKTPQCPPIGKKIKIHVVAPIETSFTTDPQYILRGSQSIVKLQHNGIIDSLRWSPDSSLSSATSDSTIASPKNTTTYKVRIYYSLNNFTCSQEDSVQIFVNTKCDVDSLRIPTAFTPNGDALNDEFYVKSFALKTILHFNVYNRWGDRVFTVGDVPADDKAYGWNGKLNNNGDDMPVGVYIYNMSAICKNDEVVNFQGEITILR